MLKKFKQQMKNEKGLTLIELLAVIVILAIVAAIAIPAIGGIIENTRIKAVKADAQNVLSAANLFFTENAGADGATVTIKVLTDDGFLEDAGSLDEGGTVTKGKPNKFTGKGQAKGGQEVSFTSASSEAITDSGKSLTVPTP